jgi:hypothetical protein
VLQILSQTAEKVGGYTYSNNPTWPLSTRSNELGYGRINLKDAIIATPNPGGTPPPPPTLVHNFVINTLTVNPTPVSAGGTINISCTVATQNPTYSSVNVMTQYRVSINTTWGDGDDIIVGTTSGNLGGGVTTDIETLTYNVGTSTGTRYLLARVNYMGTVSETNSNDNTSTSTFVINQVTQTGTDALSYFAVPSTPSITTNLQSQSFRWGIRNNGTTTITSLSYRRGWVNCPPSAGPWATPCVQTFTWTGTILPGQTVFLPSSTGWTSVNLCFSSTSCAIPLGGTNTYFFEILTVNGAPDSNASNNYSQCVVTRTATATNNNDNSDIEYVEVRVSSRLYENPIRYNNLDDTILEKGLNFIYIHHSDGSIEIKKIFIN